MEDVGDLAVQLHAAAAAGDAPAIRHLLSLKQLGVDVRLRPGKVARGQKAPVAERTAAHEAAAGGHYEALRVLLEAGADPWAQDGNRWTVFSAAASSSGPQALECLGLLLDRGRETDKERLERQTHPLEVAAEHQNWAAVALLLKRDLAVSATLFATAVKKGHLETVRAVLGVLAEGEERDKLVKDAAPHAARSGSAEVVRFLAQQGMLVDSPAANTSDGRTAVGYAAQANAVESLRALVELGAKIDGLTRPGAKGGPVPSALLWAAEGGSADAIRYLVSAGAQKEAQDDYGLTPLLRAASCGHAAAIEALVECGCDLSAVTTGPFGTPLREGVEPRGIASFAPALSHPSVVRLLRSRGVQLDLNVKSELFQRGPLIRAWTMMTPLGHAAKRGDADAVRFLLEQGAAVDERGVQVQRGFRGDVSESQHWTPLLEAAHEGHLDVIRALVAAGADLNAAGTLYVQGLQWTSGRPLEAAISRGKADAARLLLELGSDVSDAAYASEGRPPVAALPLAAEAGELELVRELLARGASASSRHAHPQSPYELAAAGDHDEILRLLIEREPPPRELVNQIAFAAAKNGAAGCLRVALDGGADVHVRLQAAQHATYSTPLLAAAEGGFPACVRLLLERGANAGDVEGHPPPKRKKEDDEDEPPPPPPDPNALPYVLTGASAIERAAKGGHAAVIRLLAARGAPVDRPDSGLDSALAIAADAGGVEAVRALLECGADPARPNAHKGTGVLDAQYCSALHEAAHDANLECVRALLDGGAPVDLPDTSGRTPLMRILASGGKDKHADKLGCIREFLKRGADPTHGWDTMPTIPACLLYQVSDNYTKNRMDIMRILDESGFRFPPRSPISANALMFAISHGVLQIARFMLERGVDPSMSYLSEEERSALHLRGQTFLIAAMEAGPGNRGQRLDGGTGNEEEDFFAVLRLLLAGGCPVNEADEDGDTPLHIAVTKLAAPVAAVLLDAGADLEALDKEGNTPLLRALAQRKSDDVAEFIGFLLDRGANVGARDGKGRSAAAVAAHNGDLETLRVLMERGAGRHATEGEIIFAACSNSRSRNTRDVLGVLLQDELREVSPESFQWPAVERGADGQLAGRAKGYATALAHAMRDSGEAAADDARQWMDLLLCCRGALRQSELRAPKRPDASDPRLLAASAAARILRLEKRVEPEPPADPKKKSQRRGRGGDSDEEEEAAPEDWEAADARDRETALQAACRHGFLLTALRLARAVPTDDVDATDAEGETALSRAVAFGPPLFGVCTALIQRGADLGRPIGNSDGGRQRSVLDATRDTAYRARLKKAAAVRDAFISYGHHPPEVARFTAQLRDRLQYEQVTCWMDEMKPSGIEAGTEWREQIGAGIKAARVVVFIASKHSCASDWCMLELSRARDLGRPVFPVWAEPAFPLDDRAAGMLLGARFQDFSAPAKLEAGFAAFLGDVRRAVEGAADGEGEGGQSAAQSLLATPEARCDLASREPFCLLWCLPEDAPRAATVVSALSFRGFRCWVDCPVAGAGPPPDGERALAACAAFVPLLSPASCASDALRPAVQRARAAARPIRPLLLSGLQVPASLEYSLARTRKYAFFSEDDGGFFACMDELLSDVGDGAPTPAPAAAGPPALHAPATGPERGRAETLQAEIAASERELEAAERELTELEQRVAKLEGSGRGTRRGKGGKKGGATPPPAPPVLEAAPGAPAGAGSEGGGGASRREAGDQTRSRACAVM